MRLKHYFLYTIFILTLMSCGNKEKASVVVSEDYVDRYIREATAPEYSIVLNDMNVTEQDNKVLFQHKYNILKIEQDSLKVDSLDWKPVNEDLFLKHENDLGMEIVSYHDSKLSRIAKPVGFDWAIGNTEHGEWVQESDSLGTTSNRQVWRPRSSSLFWYWMLRRPAYQNDYSNYRTFNRSGRAYYGSSTSYGTQYGTRSAYQEKKRSSFYTRKSNSSSWTAFKTSKKSASTPRYDGASGYRSRSGGFGK
jgi:hypothetical protein